MGQGAGVSMIEVMHVTGQLLLKRTCLRMTDFQLPRGSETTRSKSVGLQISPAGREEREREREQIRVQSQQYSAALALQAHKQTHKRTMY